MLDDEFHIAKNSKASLVSIVCPKLVGHDTAEETSRSLAELRELLLTLGVTPGDEHIQNRKTIDPGTILGSGKLDEIAKLAKDTDVDLLVFDFELTAGQVKNIKKVTGIAVVDRAHIILEIFAEHARTKEAKIQIEMARLQYLLPRLSGFWSHLGRQRGGVGVLGGEGEQQIELDRRIIRTRIEFYKRELKEVKKSRIEQGKSRKNSAITAALVGYTNAGKSSLLNRLCKVNVLEEDKLFATLDSTYRTLTPDTRPPMILIDTVGFISNLPNTLIDGFKTTLESALEADLLIIVCDISNPHYEKHLETTRTVLKELKIDSKEQLIVFNKRDLLQDKLKEKIILKTNRPNFLVSSFDPEDISNLRDYIINYFLDKQDSYDLFIPYHDGNSHSKVVSKTNIITTENHEKGIFYRVKAPKFIFNGLGVSQYILAKKRTL